MKELYREPDRSYLAAKAEMYGSHYANAGRENAKKTIEK